MGTDPFQEEGVRAVLDHDRRQLAREAYGTTQHTHHVPHDTRIASVSHTGPCLQTHTGAHVAYLATHPGRV